MLVTRHALTIAIAVLVAGCTASAPTPPTNESSAPANASTTPTVAASSSASPFACPSGDGSRFGAPGPEYRQDARDCLWNAYAQGRPSVFNTTGYTIEGARYTWTLAVNSDGSISAIRGLVEPRTFLCRTLTKEPKEGDPSKYGFRLTDCGAGVSFVNVP